MKILTDNITVKLNKQEFEDIFYFIDDIQDRNPELAELLFKKYPKIFSLKKELRKIVIKDILTT